MYGTWTDWLACMVVYFCMTCFGISMTYHRLLSHKAWQAPNWFRRFGILCGVLSAVGTPLSFVSQHRDHHRYLDKPEDAYSRTNNPWWYVQWFTMLEPISLKSAPDLIKDSFCIHMHRYFIHYHLLYATLLFFIDPWLIVVLYLAPVALVWNAANMLNSVSHQPSPGIGYRNHGQNDSSVCIPLVGYITFGEGWHSNHHADARNPNFGQNWWEVDIGYEIIRLLRLK